MKSTSSALKIRQSFAIVWKVFVNRQGRKCPNCLAVVCFRRILPFFILQVHFFLLIEPEDDEDDDEEDEAEEVKNHKHHIKYHILKKNKVRKHKKKVSLGE